MGRGQAAELVEGVYHPDLDWGWEIHRAISKARADGHEPEAEKILRDAMSMFGVDESVLIIALKVAREIAEDILRQERVKMSLMYQDFVNAVTPLVNAGLGPYDKITSVAVEGPDGEVRVLKL